MSLQIIKRKRVCACTSEPSADCSVSVLRSKTQRTALPRKRRSSQEYGRNVRRHNAKAVSRMGIFRKEGFTNCKYKKALLHLGITQKERRFRRKSTVSSLKFYTFFIFKVEILRISSFFMLFFVPSFPRSPYFYTDIAPQPTISALNQASKKGA